MSAGAKCGGCRKALRGDSVQCSICEIWFDLKCADIDSETFKFLNSSSVKKSSIHWNCDSCEASAKKLMDMITVTNNKVDQLTKVVELLDTKVEQRFENLGQGLNSAVESFQTKLEEAVNSLNEKLETVASSPKVSSLINRDKCTGSEQHGQNSDASGVKSYADIASSAMITQVATELKEREKRALNVVCAGEITEDKINSFVEAAGAEKPSNVLKIQTPKKALYIVTMASERDKWSLIGKARTISQTKEGLENIFVNPDLTKSERNVQYELRKEVRDRRKLGENVKISKGKVVQVQK